MLVAGIAWASNQDRAGEEQVLDATKMLVEELGADVKTSSPTPAKQRCMTAAYRGAKNSVVQYLFDKGGKLDVVDKSGRTPLQVAEGVEYGNPFAREPAYRRALARKLGAKEETAPRSVPECDSGEEVCGPPEEPVR